MVDVLSWICSAIALVVTLRFIRNKGLMEGGRQVWVYTLLLVPVWFTSKYASLSVDARTFCAAGLLIGFLMQPVVSQGPIRWYFSDFALALVCVGIVITQFAREPADPLSSLDKIVNLVLPYFVGRLFLRSVRDIETILPAFAVAITIAGCWAFVEGVTRRNPIEIFLGRPWLVDVLNSYDEVRWGLKRAYGPQTHAIYFGLTFAMTMPWALEAGIRAWERQGPRWWLLVPVMSFLGIVATGSRAAQIAVMAAFVGAFFNSFPKWRWAVIVFGVVGAIGFEVARDDVIKLLEESIGENKEGEEVHVVINGEEYPYSGTKHRDLLYLVYEEAIDKNEWLGYGVNMKNMPKDPKMDPRFDSIDNHYLMWFLQFGHLGLVLFGILALSFLGNLLSPIFFSKGPAGRLAGGIFGAMIGTVLAMRGVWFASDYAWVYLFCGGLSTCLPRLPETVGGAATNV